MPVNFFAREVSALIGTNKRSPDFHVSTVVSRPIGEAFENVACAYSITRAELLRRLVLALVETIKRGVDVLPREIFFPHPLHRFAPWNLSSERTFTAWANKFDTIWTYGGSAFPLQLKRARALRGIVAVPANRLFFRFPTKARRPRHGGILPEPWILGGPARPALPASLRRK
jgi:hypothetical protein